MSSTRARTWRLGKGLSVPGGKPPAQPGTGPGGAGLDEVVGGVERVEHRRRIGTGPSETKGRCQPSGILGLETHAN